MKLEVLRVSSALDSTSGLLFDVTNGRKFLCYTLEDEYRNEKVMHETRVPAGTYTIRAVFNGTAVNVDTRTFEAGQSYLIKCFSGMNNCRVE